MNLQKVPEANPETAIDWSKSYIWVAPSCRVHEADGTSPDSYTVDVTREDGATFTLPRDQLRADYFFVESEQAWKPRYRPIKANYVAEATMFRLRNRKPMFIDAGGAILCDEKGKFHAVEPDEYANCYQVVGFPGTPYPRMPFQP